MTRAPLLLVSAIWFVVPAAAQSLVVVQARGVKLEAGSRLDEERPVKIPAGGKLVVVRSDGTVITLLGPHDGPVRSKALPNRGAGRALAALVTTRNDRANRVGAVRSGSNAAPLPSPWFIDITRPGERCLVEGTQISWWRPVTTASQDFTLFPLDRSWNAQFRFAADQEIIAITQEIIAITKASYIDGTKSFLIKDDEREYSIRLHLIPNTVTEPAVVTGWMIEKGCVQQADALLAYLSRDVKQGIGE